MSDQVMRIEYRRVGCLEEPIVVVFPDSEEFREELLVTSLGNGQWRLEETPLFSSTARYHDVIEATVTPEHDLALVRIVQPSRMRTVWYSATREWRESLYWQQLRDRIRDEGGEWELIWGGILIVHVPLDSSLDLGRAMWKAGALIDDTAIQESADGQ